MRKDSWKSTKAGALKGPATLDQVRADVGSHGLRFRGHPIDVLYRLSKRNARRSCNVKLMLEHAEAEAEAVVDVRKWAVVMLANSPEAVNSA